MSFFNFGFENRIKEKMIFSSRTLLQSTFCDLTKILMILMFLMNIYDGSCSCSSRFTFNEHTCIRTSTQQIKCFGDNLYGQLGYGDTNDRGDESNEMSDYLPYVNLDGDNVASVHVGEDHSCVHLSSFEVKCWGYNLLWPTWLWRS